MHLTGKTITGHFTTDKALLWENGVLGNSSAETLQNTVFFYACKLFALRDHDKHNQLQCDQFTLGVDQGGNLLSLMGVHQKRTRED